MHARVHSARYSGSVRVSTAHSACGQNAHDFRHATVAAREPAPHPRGGTSFATPALCECMSVRRHRLAACLRTHPRDESLCAPGGDGSGAIPPWCVCVSVCVCVRRHTRIGAWLQTHPRGESLCAPAPSPSDGSDAIPARYACSRTTTWSSWTTQPPFACGVGVGSGPGAPPSHCHL